MKEKYTAPCGRDCPNRAAGCHGKCEAYQAFRAELDKNAVRDKTEGEVISYYRARRTKRLHKESRKAK